MVTHYILNQWLIETRCFENISALLRIVFTQLTLVFD
jgi:hypothetical protein